MIRLLILGRLACIVKLFVVIPEFLLDVQWLSREVLGSLLPDMRRQALRRDIVQLLMVNEHFRWQSFENPLMSNRFVWCHALIRVPLKTPLNEIYERLVTAVENVIQNFCARFSHLTLRVWNKLWHVILVEEFSFALALGKHFRLRDATYLHDETYLIRFILSWEDRVAHGKLSHDAPETPHINARSILDA